MIDDAVERMEAYTALVAAACDLRATDCLFLLGVFGTGAPVERAETDCERCAFQNECVKHAFVGGTQRVRKWLIRTQETSALHLVGGL